MPQTILIYFPLAKWVFIAAMLIWKHQAIGSFIYACLGSPGKEKSISSKRVISISGMATLIYSITQVVNKGKILPPAILWALVTIILTASAIATFPEIFGLIREIKSIIPAIGGKGQDAGESKIPDPIENQANNN